MGNQQCALCKVQMDDETQDGRGHTPDSSHTMLKAPSTTTDRRKYDANHKDSPRANATSLTNAGSTSSTTSFFAQFGFRSDTDKMKRRSSKPGAAEILDMWQLNEESSESGSFSQMPDEKDKHETDCGEKNTKKLDVSEEGNRLSKSFDSSLAPISSLNTDLLPKETAVQPQDAPIPAEKQTTAERRNDVEVVRQKDVKPGTPQNQRIHKPQKPSRQDVLNKLIDSDNDSGNASCSDEEEEKYLKMVDKRKDHRIRPCLEDKMKAQRNKLLFDFHAKRSQMYRQIAALQFGMDQSLDQTENSQMLKTMYLQQFENINDNEDGAMTDIHDIERLQRQTDAEQDDGLESANISRISKCNSNLFFKRQFVGISAAVNPLENVQNARERILSECIQASDMESMQLSDIGGLELSSRKLRRQFGLVRLGMTTDDQGFTTNYDESAATDNNDLISMLRGFSGNNGPGPQGILAMGSGGLRRNDSIGFSIQRAATQDDNKSVDLSLSECEKGLTSGVEQKIMDIMRMSSVPNFGVKETSEPLAPIDELPAVGVSKNSPRCSALKNQEYPMPIRQNESITPQSATRRVRRDSLKIESERGASNKDKESTSGGESDYMTDVQQKFQAAILCHEKKKVPLAVLEANAQKQAQLTSAGIDQIGPRKRSSDESPLMTTPAYKPFVSAIHNNSGDRKVLRRTFKEDQHAKSKKLMDSSDQNASKDVRMPDDDEMAQSFSFKSKHFQKKKRRPQQASNTTMNATNNASGSPKGGSGAFAPRVALII